MFKMIRAGIDYNPAILVTPPDAKPGDADATYYERSSIKDGNNIPGWKPGEFNEIPWNEACFAFGGMSAGWGFAEIPDQPFPTLEAALAFVAPSGKEYCAQLLEEARAASVEHDRAVAATEKAVELLQQKRRALLRLCTPPCQRAVDEYNKKAEFAIVVQNLRIIFADDYTKLSFNARLNRAGREPDEEFTHEDNEVGKISAKLARVVNRHLRSAGISLKFGELAVPSTYYMK